MEPLTIKTPYAVIKQHTPDHVMKATKLLCVAVFGGVGVFAGDDAGFCCGVLI